ncbi:MAG: HPr family phosphocarrier protein [Lachnospiraceae bacterium]|nr:HPr family phosphocarrier protein [Lachnospiraceae bacterium]
MVSQNVRVNISSGLHFRPAGKLTELAMSFEAEITLAINGHEANAKSFLGVLAACIKNGDEVTVICDGTDEQMALEKITGFLTGEQT